MLCPIVLDLSVRDYIEFWTVYTVFDCKCFLLFSVTENHPEVKAMVLSALEEAKHMNTSPFSLYAEVLETHIKEVGQKSETWQLHSHKLFGPKRLSAYIYIHHFNSRYLTTPLFF